MRKQTHECGVGGCESAVPMDKLMCPKHWAMVPSALQERIYRTWRLRGRGDGYVREHRNACLEAKRAVETEIARRADVKASRDAARAAAREQARTRRDAQSSLDV